MDLGESEETKKKDFLSKLKKTADQAAKTGAELSKKAAERGPEFGKSLKEQTFKAIEEGISSGRKAAASGDKNLELLRKLAELKGAGIISEEEFQTKKKEILERI